MLIFLLVLALATFANPAALTKKPCDPFDIFYKLGYEKFDNKLSEVTQAGGFLYGSGSKVYGYCKHSDPPKEAMLCDDGKWMLEGQSKEARCTALTKKPCDPFDIFYKLGYEKFDNKLSEVTQAGGFLYGSGSKVYGYCKHSDPPKEAMLCDDGKWMLEGQSKEARCTALTKKPCDPFDIFYKLGYEKFDNKLSEVTQAGGFLYGSGSKVYGYCKHSDPPKEAMLCDDGKWMLEGQSKEARCTALTKKPCDPFDILYKLGYEKFDNKLSEVTQAGGFLYGSGSKVYGYCKHSDPPKEAMLCDDGKWMLEGQSKEARCVKRS